MLRHEHQYRVASEVEARHSSLLRRQLAVCERPTVALDVAHHELAARVQQTVMCERRRKVIVLHRLASVVHVLLEVSGDPVLLTIVVQTIRIQSVETVDLLSSGLSGGPPNVDLAHASLAQLLVHVCSYEVRQLLYDDVLVVVLKRDVGVHVALESRRSVVRVEPVRALDRSAVSGAPVAGVFVDDVA